MLILCLITATLFAGCANTNTNVRLGDSSSGPRYQCEEISCSLTFPAAVHERLLDEIIKILNIKGGLIGYVWKKRIMGCLYSFEIYEYDFETGVTVGVNRLS